MNPIEESEGLWITPILVSVGKPKEKIAKNWVYRPASTKPYMLCGYPNGRSGEECPLYAEYEKPDGCWPYLFACIRHTPKEETNESR